jgi:phosphoglycerate dehydrogenase-like enzyme
VWRELAGKTIGILGYGRIGQAVARRARAFDMKICAVRRDVRRSIEDNSAFLGGPDSTDEVIGRSDYVLISMPAVSDTVGLMDRRRLGLMKSTAYLINVARAEIVDEGALYEALAERSIADAVLDVWYRYPHLAGPAPPATRPFHDLPNVLMTPHVSGWTDGMLDARAKLIAENIRRIAHRETPLNLVDP